MTEVCTIARQIQQLEVYLNNLVSALTRGELPVNLHPITQIFDNALASIPPILNLQQDRFIELYNDLPHLFTAYAIDVTLSEDSFIRQDRDITFYRFIRGNYWIIPTQSEPDRGWLVPNPSKGVSLDRMPSLAASFDRELIPNINNPTCILVAPAKVKILPIVEPLSWKLVERSRLTNSQIQQSSTPTTLIDSLVQKLSNLNDRVSQIERTFVKFEAIQTLTFKQQQLQAISAKVVEQLTNKQQEILAISSQLSEVNGRAAQQERELNGLKIQMASLGANPTINSITETDRRKEILSLKIEIEKLKGAQQQRQGQQVTHQRETLDLVQKLVTPEIAKFQSGLSIKEVETIDAQIVTRESKPSISNEQSYFAKLYNAGEKEFLRSYMVSTAALVRKTNQSIELVEDNIGLYWIIPFKTNTHYLVPRIDFPNDSKYIGGLTVVFDGKNDTANFLLFKPAIVILTKTNIPKQWKLERKGYLDHKLTIE